MRTMLGDPDVGIDEESLCTALCKQIMTHNRKFAMVQRDPGHCGLTSVAKYMMGATPGMSVAPSSEPGGKNNKTKTDKGSL